MRSFVLRCCLAALTGGAALAQNTDFAETYALAPDRAAILDQLVPGTVDFYYYQCLHRQQTGRLGEVRALLTTWRQLHGQSQRMLEIERRQALLGYTADPAQAYDYLRTQLGLRFDRQRETTGERSDLPSRLDPALLAPARLRQEALSRHQGSLDGFTDLALESLAVSNLDDRQLLALLQRLRRPDLPNLPALIHRQLAMPNQGIFGSLEIHKRLTLAQLDELLQLRPSLLEFGSFVDVYAQRLQPTAAVLWQQDAAERSAYLARLWAFAQRLAPAHNAFKAHVLYHYIVHDLEQGALDKERFLAFVRLPRQQSFVNPDFLRRSRRTELADERREFATSLPGTGDEEALVRAGFEEIFRTEDSIAGYSQFVRDSWLERVLAETRLLAGDPDSERWYAMLRDPAYYQRLVERIELTFPRSQAQHFKADAAVSIDLDVKNVRQLLVKVYAIDAYAYGRSAGKEVDAAIDLDGVQPNSEKLHEYDEPPLRRVRRTFAFPELQGAGTWVVEFVGNGMSSRAVIQKGRLHALERLGAAGHSFTVLDEAGQVVRDAVAFVANREYRADEGGEIVVPFAPTREQRTMVLGRGALASLRGFWHLEEAYALSVGVFVERETLVAGRQTRLLVRPQLTVQGAAIAPALLEDVVLEIKGVRQDGTEAIQTVRAPQWDPAGEYVHRFTVPERLASLRVSLRGKVEKLSEGKKVDVAAESAQFDVNGIDATAAIQQTLVGRDADGWFVDVRGRTGEPVVGRAVHMQLHHREYRDPVPVALATDDAGRIRLGELPGVTYLSTPVAQDEPRGGERWLLDTEQAPLPGVVTGLAGETLHVPVVATAGVEPRASLLELRGGMPYRDASSSLRRLAGHVALVDLPAGDYELAIDDRVVPVLITAGRMQGTYAIGAHRAMPVRGRGRLQIESLDSAAEELVIRLANAGDDARVHVVATRYLPAFSPATRLAVDDGAGSFSVQPLVRSESVYSAGRQLADELRYVLERRYATKYPGNMLTRPSLLLNPWHPTNQWDTAAGIGGAEGGRFGGRGGPGSPGPATGGASQDRRETANAIAFANLDFLPGPGATLANLRPDASGVVRVRRADLADNQFVAVVAVDIDDIAQRSLALEQRALQPRDLTLQDGLQPDGHFAQQRRVEFVAPGGEAVIGDVRTAEVETMATLADAFNVLRSLLERRPHSAGSRDLAEFEFLMRWPSLSDDERRELYRSHGSHEFHFFVYHKDRAWFDAVLRPMLADKAHKTFLDHWLLGADLTSYLQPYAFAQLNLIEQILLLQRRPDRAGALLRYVRERGELLRVEPLLEKLLFDSVLGSRGLETNADGVLLVADPTQAPAADREADLFAANAPQAGGGAAGRPAGRKPRAAERSRSDDKDAGAPDDAPAESVEELRKVARAELQQMQQDAGRRRNQVALWRAPEPTRRYIERDYWNTPRAEQSSDLVAANEFWREFAAAAADAPFVSRHFAQASGSVTEAMMALALLDLPFTSEEPEQQRDGARLTLRPRTPTLLVRSELLAAEEAKDADPVLVRQDHFRLDDRYVWVGAERRTKYVRDEFLTGTAYGCQVVVTNPTATPRRVELLLQIPRGAMPLQGSEVTASTPVELGAFATATAEYAYYFPVAGEHGHFPVHVGAEGRYLAAAAPVALKAVDQPTVIDTTSWEHVSQNASNDAVLEYLGQANLQRTDLSRIEWRLRDRAFFGQVVDLLRAHFVYHDGVWAHAVLHRDQAAAAEYLANQAAFVAQCGRVLRSPLLDIDPIERRAYEHAEFMPLHHSRAHQIGVWRRIPNGEVAVQWRAFVEVMASTDRLTAIDLASATYFLLLQNRIEEALATFARVDREALPAKLQYDYMAAYLGFFTEDLQRSRQIAERYRDHPVARWRLLFRDVLQQLDEARGAGIAATDPRDRDQQQAALAASQPMIDVAVQGDEVIVRHQNVTACEIRYHLLDVEFAFSTSPFAEQGATAVAYVEPRLRQSVDLVADARQTAVPLPEQFRRGNVVVEVRAGGIARRATHLASAMTLQTMESYGQLQVTQADNQTPLPRVYVKVFARLANGQVRFHKDGYTDLRGRFDYASVSESGTESAQRFAILVLSERDGAVIREVAGMQ